MRQLVSVIIPTIGRLSLERTIQSVMDQTYEEVETVVVRDSARRGAPWARNLGASKAGGDFFMFVDDDCVLEKNAVASLVQGLAQNPRCAYAYGWFLTGGKVQGRTPFSAKILRKKNYVARALIRRSAFPGFDEKLRRWQDWELVLRMLSKGHTGVFVNEKILTEPGPNGISLDQRALLQAYEVLHSRYGITHRL